MKARTPTVVLVCVMAAVVVSSTAMAYGNQPHAQLLDQPGWALLALNVLALAWLPWRTEVALTLAAGAAAAFFALGYALALWPAPALIAMFSAIAAGRPGGRGRRSWRRCRPRSWSGRPRPTTRSRSPPRP